jgi:hypothetical protein
MLERGWLPGPDGPILVILEGHVAMTGREYERLLASEGVCQACIHFAHERCRGCACTERQHA